MATMTSKKCPKCNSVLKLVRPQSPACNYFRCTNPKCKIDGIQTTFDVNKIKGD